MRYLVMSDVHLNINRRFEDTLDALDQVYALIGKHKVGKVLILGDVYTSRRPHSKEKAAFERWIRRVIEPRLDSDGLALETPISVIIVKGNHDEAPDYHSFTEFTELHIPGVEVRDNPTFEGEFFLGHLLLREAQLGTSDYQNPDCMSAAELVRKYPSPLRSGAPCKAYLLGDVHKGQTIQENPLIIYAGSINRVDFGERDDEKSVILIDDIDEYPKFTYRRLPLKSRPMVQYDLYPPFVVEPTRAEEGAIVKVVFHGTREQVAGVNEANLRESLSSAKELIIKYDIGRESTPRDEKMNESISPSDALRRYLESQGLSGEELQKTLAAGEEIINACFTR